MMFLIIISKRLNINPDNVATVCIKIQFIIHNSAGLSMSFNLIDSFKKDFE